MGLPREKALIRIDCVRLEARDGDSHCDYVDSVPRAITLWEKLTDILAQEEVTDPMVQAKLNAIRAVKAARKALYANLQGAQIVATQSVSPENAREQIYSLFRAFVRSKGGRITREGQLVRRGRAIHADGWTIEGLAYYLEMEEFAKCIQAPLGLHYLERG